MIINFNCETMARQFQHYILTSHKRNFLGRTLSTMCIFYSPNKSLMPPVARFPVHTLGLSLSLCVYAIIERFAFPFSATKRKNFWYLCSVFSEIVTGQMGCTIDSEGNCEKLLTVFFDATISVFAAVVRRRQCHSKSCSTKKNATTNKKQATNNGCISDIDTLRRPKWYSSKFRIRHTQSTRYIACLLALSIAKSIMCVCIVLL